MTGGQTIFGKRTPSLLGVDISASSVKLVELGRSGDNYRLDRYCVEPLLPGAMVEHAVADVDAVGVAIRRAVNRCGSKRRHAAVAVAASDVISKVIGMPGQLKPKDLEDQVEVEANHYIPYPLDEVNFDFEVIGPAADTPGEDDVLLVACRKEIVDGYLAALERAGLTPLVVDVDAYAVENLYPILERQLPADRPETTLAVMDFGAITTRTNIIHEGRSVYTREHAFGGRRVFEDIQRNLDVSDDELRQMQASGDIPSDQQIEVVQPFLDTMGQEASRALQFFFSSSTFDSVDHLFVMGGCAQFASVEQAVSKRTKLPTTIVNPFTGMTISGRLRSSSLQRQAPALAVATGLALRSFDA